MAASGTTGGQPATPPYHWSCDEHRHGRHRRIRIEPRRREAAKRGWLRRSWDKHWYAWAMVAPVVIVLGVLIFYPLARGIFLSFTNLTEANQLAEICTKSITGTEDCEPNPNAGRFVGFDNYVEVLTGEVGEFWQWFGITLIWTVACVVFHYGIGLGLAVLLNRPMRGRGVYRVLLILPWAVPAFVSAFAWRFMFNQEFGLINGVLSAIGLEPVAWFDNQWTSLFTAIVTNIWLGVPFMMVSLLGGMQTISGRALRGGRRSTAPRRGSGSSTSRCPACARSA